MDSKNKSGLENVVASEESAMKDKKHKYGIKIPYYLIAGISSLFAVGSACFTGLAVYKTIDEYMKVDPAFAALIPPDEPSAYDTAIGYGCVAFIALLATSIFIKTVIDAVKEAREM